MVEAQAQARNKNQDTPRDDRPSPIPPVAQAAAPTAHRALREDMHYRVLRLLEQNPRISQRALARELGVSLGGAHYVLRALIEKGLVKARSFAGAPRKTAYAYVLTPAGLTRKTALTRAFLMRKRAEYEALREEIASLEAEVGEGK